MQIQLHKQYYFKKIQEVHKTEIYKKSSLSLLSAFIKLSKSVYSFKKIH